MATMYISLNVFEMLAHKARTWFVFPTPPLFDAPHLGGTHQKFWMKLTPTKTRGMQLLYGETFIIFCFWL